MAQKAADTATEMIEGHDEMEGALMALLDTYEAEGLCPQRLAIVRYHVESAFMHLARLLQPGKPRVSEPGLELMTQ